MVGTFSIHQHQPQHLYYFVSQEGAKFDLLLCINMIHISPWSATLGLFNMAGKVLRWIYYEVLFHIYQKRWMQWLWSVCLYWYWRGAWNAWINLTAWFSRPNGKLVTYGPYAQDGVLTPESNQQVEIKNWSLLWSISVWSESSFARLIMGYPRHQGTKRGCSGSRAQLGPGWQNQSTNY